MVPRVSVSDESVSELSVSEYQSKPVSSLTKPRQYEIVYKNIFIHIYLHYAAFNGLYLCFTEAKWQTIFFAYISYVAATIGVTAGAHRLWSHKAFKAKLPLEIILVFFLSIANQRATHWVRDHRVHHKYSDTDADPHNASRGFFYSHMGWLFVRKHSEVKRCGQLIDLSDLYSNPVLMFQHNSYTSHCRTYPWLGLKFTSSDRYSKFLLPTISLILPTLIPLLWGETLFNAWNITIMRLVFNFHVFFLVNSAAHLIGNKPYDKNIMSGENKLVSLATFGEGFHNYHHVFPWDYRNSELGNSFFNYTKLFIELAAKIGWAYDLKIVPDHIIKSRSTRTGDGSCRSVQEDILQ